MESRKVLSGLCYLSVFFAAFIFPLVVFFASGDDVTKMNAKKALLSHLMPLIPVPLLIISIIYESQHSQIPVFTIICAVLIVLISLVVVIWNIVKGVKAFQME